MHARVASVAYAVARDAHGVAAVAQRDTTLGVRLELIVLRIDAAPFVRQHTALPPTVQPVASQHERASAEHRRCVSTVAVQVVPAQHATRRLVGVGARGRARVRARARARVRLRARVGVKVRVGLRVGVRVRVKVSVRG